MKLEHRIDFRWLILFALPTIFSSIFANLYSTVDGIFVALYVDTDALSAINITMPMTYLALALGMMFGSGGNALVARKIGEGRHQEAREDFSLMMAVAFVFSVVLTVACFLFLDPLCRFLGSDEALLHYCREYMIPVLISIPFAVFGMVFQLSFITVGKAGLGAFLNVLGGVSQCAGRRFEHGAGLAVHGGVPLGADGGRHCDQHRLCPAVHRGRDLLLHQPQAGASCGPAQMARENHREQLHQQLLRDGKRAGLFGHYHSF